MPGVPPDAFEQIKRALRGMFKRSKKVKTTTSHSRPQSQQYHHQLPQQSRPQSQQHQLQRSPSRPQHRPLIVPDLALQQQQPSITSTGNSNLGRKQAAKETHVGTASTDQDVNTPSAHSDEETVLASALPDSQPVHESPPQADETAHEQAPLPVKTFQPDTPSSADPISFHPQNRPPTSASSVGPRELSSSPASPSVPSEFLHASTSNRHHLRSMTSEPGAPPSADPLPVESPPVESAPVESAPVEAVPVESVPAESEPAESVIAESTPVESVPIDPPRPVQHDDPKVTTSEHSQPEPVLEQHDTDHAEVRDVKSESMEEAGADISHEHAQADYSNTDQVTEQEHAIVKPQSQEEDEPEKLASDPSLSLDGSATRKPKAELSFTHNPVSFVNLQDEPHQANEAARRAPAVYHDEKIPVMAEPPQPRPISIAPGMVATSGPLEDFPFR